MPELNVKVITPEKVVFDGPAQAISSKNQQGDLSVVPQHTNFISIIQEKLSVIKTSGEPQEIPLDQGIIYCRGDQVEIYIGLKSSPQSPANKGSKKNPSNLP